MSNNIITREFEKTEIQFKIDEQGQSFVRIDEVARFCGWTQIKNGKDFIRWETVNKYLEELNSQLVGKGDFIPEYIMYPLIGKAKNERATKFMLWVGQVLTQLRTKGVVITEKATEEAIDFEKKYGTYRIRKTFTNSNNLRADYEEFKDLSKAEWKAKRLSGQDRIKLHNIIFDAISKRLQNNITELKGSEMLAMQELLTDIKSDTLKLCNNVNGGIKRGQTQEIGKLKAELEAKEVEHNQILQIYQPKDDDYITIEEYPISKNSLYDAVLDYNTGEPRFVCSNKYNKWKHWFKIKADEAGLREAFSNVNFDEDVFISYKVIAPYGYDVSNLINPLQDILADYFDCMSDQKFHICNTEIEGYYSDIKDGSIKIYLCNKGDF
nr:MAG TPA: hypothetical protein [Caudoviricetes sp.]